MGTQDREGRIGGREELRRWGGDEVPAPGRWAIDASGSRLAFVVRYRRTGRVRGRFAEVGGIVHVAERPEDSALEARIRAASVRTGIPLLDRVLRSRRILNVGRYPELRFRSTGVEVLGPRELRVDGELTVRDVTRPVTLLVEYAGSRHRAGAAAAVFRARGEVDRAEFGLGWKTILGIPVSRRPVLVDLRVSLSPDRP